MTRPHLALEVVTLAALGAGALLTILGALGSLATTAGSVWGRGSVLVLALGLLLLATACVAGHPLDRLRRFGASRALDRYEEVRLATRLRIGSLMLHVLLPLALVVEGLAIPARLGLLHLPFATEVLARGALGLTAVLAGVHAFSHWTSLHLLPRRTGDARTLLTVLGSSLVVVLGLLMGLTALGGRDAGDVPLLALGAAAAGAFAITASRGLPTLAAVLASDRSLSGGPVISRNRAVFLPVLSAFALLMLVFLLFIVLGIGVVGTFANVARDPVVLGLFAFLFLALVLSLLAALRLSRSEPLEPPLFQVKTDSRRLRERILLGVSGGVAGLLLLAALLLFQGTRLFGLPSASWVHFFCLAILAALGPYGFYAASEQRRIRLLEERFPDFLRDIASSHRGGLTLANSIQVAARGDYGPLTPEVQKMADQVSWNVGFQEVLQRFAERVRTPLVQRAVTLILQADRSGGATTEVLVAAARDAREIKTLENERRVAMSLYTVVVYVTFFVFLGVAAILYAQFVPQLVAASQAASQQTTLKSLGALEGSPLQLQDFQLFYLLAAVVQGAGDGIVAGLMGSGKAVLGLRHAFIMVLLSYLCFALFLS